MDKNNTSRGEGFYAATRVLGEFIKRLPLSSEQSNKLIFLVMDQVKAAERGAFSQGLLGHSKAEQADDLAQGVCLVETCQFHGSDGCEHDAEHFLVELVDGKPTCTFYEPKPGLMGKFEGVQ